MAHAITWETPTPNDGGSIVGCKFSGGVFEIPAGRKVVEMEIIQIIKTETFQTLVLFADGVSVGTLRPELNHNQPGPCVEPCMFWDQAWPYIEAATRAINDVGDANYTNGALL